MPSTFKSYCALFMGWLCWSGIVAASVYFIARLDSSLREQDANDMMVKTSCVLHDGQLVRTTCKGWCLSPLSRREKNGGEETASSTCLEKAHECYQVHFLVGYIKADGNEDEAGSTVMVNTSTLLPSTAMVSGSIGWGQQCHTCYKIEKAVAVRAQYLSDSRHRLCYFKSSNPSGTVMLEKTDNELASTIVMCSFSLFLLWCCCTGCSFYCCFYGCSEFCGIWAWGPSQAATTSDDAGSNEASIEVRLEIKQTKEAHDSEGSVI